MVIMKFVIICNEIFNADSVILFMMNLFVRSGLIITGKLEYHPKKSLFAKEMYPNFAESYYNERIF